MVGGHGGGAGDTHDDVGVEQGPVERQQADDVSGSLLLPLQGRAGGGGHGGAWGQPGESSDLEL